MSTLAVKSPLKLTREQESLIQARSQLYLEKARTWFTHGHIQPLRIQFDLSGQAAGNYYPAKNLIRYNGYIAAQNFEHFLRQTVPHEVAHHVVHQITRATGIKARAHGAEWQALMRRFGATPERCHDYDVSDIPGKQQRRFNYRCQCMEHRISATRHNRIARGYRYYCKYCRGELYAT